MAKKTMGKMKLISSREVFANKLFRVTEDHAMDPGGFEIKRAIVHHRGSAVMMAVDEKKRILLVRQYRLPARQYLWELPAGSVDEGEKVLQTAKRELVEETGYSAKKWKKISEFYPSPGFLAEKMTIFLATELTEGEATPMEDERIETRWFKWKEVDAMIESGELIDCKTKIGFLTWKRYFSK
jgi:ADP-ribose pyrophosphatase